MLFAKHRSLKIADVKDFPFSVISKIEIYNPLSALLLTFICHFYYVLLRVAIFVLNVAIATYFERRQKELSRKNSLWKIYRGKVVQFFTAQPLYTRVPGVLVEIFCGYLILRFFPNRKNSQNIVPANNSNNKVVSKSNSSRVSIVCKGTRCKY